MKLRPVLVSGLVAGLAIFLTSSVLHIAIWVLGVSPRLNMSPSSDPAGVFGQGYWWVVLLVGGLVFTVTLALLYSYAEKSIGMRSAWRKGFIFGGLSWLISRAPATYYGWLMLNYPNVASIMDTMNGIVSSIVSGVVLAIVFERMK
jgi:hypothetical protein